MWGHSGQLSMNPWELSTRQPVTPDTRMKTGMLFAIWAFIISLLVPVALAILALACYAAAASAGTTYSFSGITSNSAGDVAIGESQLSMEVSDGGLIGGVNTALFTFRNAGPAASSITQIYFDDGSLLSLGSIVEGPGTDFKVAKPQPGVLPGGNAIDFNATKGFTVEPVPPTQPNGVNPNEFVTLGFTLQNGKTFADTICALNLGLTSPTKDLAGGLRVGIHVQGFASRGSESFVNSKVAATPEPTTMVMATTALVPLVLIGRRQLRLRRQA